MENVSIFNEKALNQAWEFINKNDLVTQIYKLKKKFKKEMPLEQVGMDDFVRLYFLNFCNQFFIVEIDGLLRRGNKKSDVKKFLKERMFSCIKQAMECVCEPE